MLLFLPRKSKVFWLQLETFSSPKFHLKLTEFLSSQVAGSPGGDKGSAGGSKVGSVRTKTGP